MARQTHPRSHPTQTARAERGLRLSAALLSVGPLALTACQRPAPPAAPAAPAAVASVPTAPASVPAAPGDPAYQARVAEATAILARAGSAAIIDPAAVASAAPTPASPPPAPPAAAAAMSIAPGAALDPGAGRAAQEAAALARPLAAAGAAAQMPHAAPAEVAGESLRALRSASLAPADSVEALVRGIRHSAANHDFEGLSRAMTDALVARTRPLVAAQGPRFWKHLDRYVIAATQGFAMTSTPLAGRDGLQLRLTIEEGGQPRVLQPIVVRTDAGWRFDRF